MKTANRIVRCARPWVLAAALISVRAAAEAPRAGEALVVAHAGRVYARYPVGPVHDGRFESRALFQGAAVGERTQLMTGRDGHLCLVLSPGALVHVPPDTQLTLTRLRSGAAGLPRREEDLVREIEIELRSGRLYVNAGVPTPSLRVHVRTAAGDVAANGAVFSIAREEGEDRWSVVALEHGVRVEPKDGEARELRAGDGALLGPDGASDAPDAHRADRHAFEFCRGFFRDIEHFRHPVFGFDREAVIRYIGLDRPPVFIGTEGLVADVSPGYRSWASSRSTPQPPAVVGVPEGRRWGEERIWAWWASVGVIRGVNYVPRTAVNSTEMWMEETFDPDTIDEELGWAKGVGYTAVRVVLQEAVYRHDPRGFLRRLDRFLDIAGRHGLTVVPVLFDDLNRAGRDPDIGPQPDPVPDVHNARWVPSPGPARVTEPQAWPELERYVRDVIRTFRRDRRVLYWDLYNTAGNDGLWEQSLPLVDQAFNWARDIDPRQPIAVPGWTEMGRPMTARKLERSDLITFHTFLNAELTEAMILALQRYNRPIVASDWLMRQQGNTFEEILPVFATYGVGWFNRGLVRGRTQTWIQEEDRRDPEASDVWQQDVLHEDGSPYDEHEIELIRSFRYTGGR